MYDTWCTRALPYREVGSRATVHVMAPEPFLSGRRDPKPPHTWQPHSPPWLGGRIRCYRARGGMWVHALLLVLT
jgi:hypothetical protein